MSRRRKNTWIGLAVWFFTAALLVLFDQCTKRLAVQYLMGRNPAVLIEGIFEFYYTENRGAAFGMLQGGGRLFFAVAAVVIAAAAWCISRIPSFQELRLLRTAITLLTAGAAGNLIDRAVQGYVVDFLYFKLIDFPVFNVADIYVTVSAALLAVLMLLVYSDEDLACLSAGAAGKKRKNADDGRRKG